MDAQMDPSTVSLTLIGTSSQAANDVNAESHPYVLTLVSFSVLAIIACAPALRLPPFKRQHKCNT